MQTVAEECRHRERLVTTVPMREAVLRARMGQDEAIDRLVDHYRRHDCDGLFLSHVTYQGVRLPVRQLVGTLTGHEKPRFVVVDGAQALNHVPLGLAEEYWDLLLAGCHKWVRAYQPLGLAFCCRPSSEDLVTVSLAPIFTAAAAVRRMLGSGRAKRDELAVQMANADRVAEQAPGADWKPCRPASPMQSGILLLEPRCPDTRLAPVELLRGRLLTAGVALTAHAEGTIRASLPDRPFASDELSLLRSALRRCA